MILDGTGAVVSARPPFGVGTALRDATMDARPPMKLRIVSVNDVYVLDNLPRLRSLVRHHAENDAADALLVVVAGDFLSPSLLSSMDRGRAMVECLDAVGVTHVTFGNHEDDLASEDLLARIREIRARWLATNVRAFDASLPVSDVLEVRGVRVGLVGVVMNDAAVYRRAPFGGGPFESANEVALREAERLVREERCAFVVPLTHQFLRDDRALADAAAQRGRGFPVICGGHEHEPVIEEVSGTFIVKAGMDAHRAAVIDLEVTPDAVRATVRMEDVAAYPEDAELRARVERHLAKVAAMEQATLLTLAEGEVLSSIGTRARQTSLGTLVTSRLRDALGADGCLVNGGAIRGSREYRGALTYGALEAEIPFDNEMVVVSMPGRVVVEAIAASRRHAPRESGGFLQVDDGMTMDGGALVEIGGAPLEPERDYRIAVVRNFFLGLDSIEPLVELARMHPERIPPEDSGRSIRLLLVDAFAVAIWKQLGGFDAVDADHDGEVTQAELESALAQSSGQRQPQIVAELVLHALDTIEIDGVISRDEADAVE